MENKGCQVILGLIALLLVLGMVAGSLNMRGNGQEDPRSNPELFTVGSTKVNLQEFNDKLSLTATNQGASRGTPQGELALNATVVDNYVQLAAIKALAQEKGVAVTKENIRQIGEAQANQSLDQARVQLMINGQIKPDASEAEANKQLETILGKPRDQWVKDNVDALEKDFNDPEKQKELKSNLLSGALVIHYKNNVKYTEEDLKNSFSEYTFEVLRFEDLKKSLGERQDEALKALGEVKSGSKFADVQAKYNPDAKQEDKAVTLSVGLLEVDSTLKGLKDLKVGETSEILLQSGSPVIYQLKSVTTKLPKDFEASKTTLLQNARESRANRALDDDFKAKLDTFKPTFKDKGLEIAYNTYKLLTDQAAQADGVKYDASLKSQLAEAKSSTAGGNLVVAAEFILTESIYARSTAAEQKEMLKDRIDVAHRMLDNFEDADFRVRFAQELLNAGEKEEGFLFLKEAAELNSDYEAMGEAVHSQITSMNDKALADKKFTAEEHKTIKDILDKWSEEKKIADKEKAEAEAEAKKAQEELDKEVVPDPSGTSGTTGSTPPKSGSATGTPGGTGTTGN
ncbi:MAG: SurA N-terminal domain-containing protein [Fimbriimonadaceae bacterium]|nr:MAG: SurA N-terminal domain-containing protein [Fimbriimonadaceae bacterium]